MTASRKGTAHSILVRRFHESVALHVNVSDGKCGVESTETVYIPREFLLVLADALQVAHRDICHRSYSVSTFRPRTIYPNDVRFE